MRPDGSTSPSIVTFLLVVVVGSTVAGCAPRATTPIRPAALSPAAEHVVVGGLDGRTGAYLTVRDAASRVRLVLGALPGLLYRISTPAGSGLAPQVTAHDGRVQAALRPTGGDGPDEVRIVLNRDVRWDLRLLAGAGEHQLDLRQGRVTRLDIGSSGLVELRLSAPTGTVPVTLSEVGSAVVDTQRQAAVRVTVDRGADAALSPWTTPGPLPSGGKVTTPGWLATADRYAIRMLGGVGALTVR